ncbi:hypothetical protein Bca4012_003311 [Brassica carinata]
MFLSASPVPQAGVQAFVTQPSSLFITPVGHANHYMPSLKAGSIVKVYRFEVPRCSRMYKITDHPFLIRFISLTIIDEVITCASEINLQSRLDCSTISK